MTTHENRATRHVSGKIPKPGLRVNVEDLIEAKVSMLGADRLPFAYGGIECMLDVQDAMTAPPPDPRIARLTILWDNPLTGDFPLGEVLDLMRGTGAAMVLKVEEVKA